ncbi:hypothetical protein B0H12DRAFT_807424 [Mycena haematopus]|nr:hypothetical protein B0H12DRAFT_807424 [Mycena haematopus]
MRSTSEMIIQSRETIGDVPPELIGSSTALAGSKLYLFGGSLASTPEPKPLADLYVLDLELWKWEKILPVVQSPVPRACYFHTMDIWNNHLVVFGGLGAGGGSGQLQVLNDVQLFNISTRRWLRHARVPAVSPMSPIPRHSHLSCVSLNQLFIIGGRDFCDEGLTDVCVYDLGKKEWIERHQYFPPVDVNHAFAATSQWHIQTPVPDAHLSGNTDGGPRAMPLSYSERVTDKSPPNIYVYNADHLKLEVLSSWPLSGGQIQKERPPPVAIPFLRFPSGGILGKTLIVAGNNSADKAFSIWSLDLETRTSVCIDTGQLLKNGSWAKAFLWHEQNKLFMFGKAGGNFVDVADRLALGWDAVTVVDLEALGIYQPPTLTLDAAAQQLGLESLAEAQQADFAFHCDDGRRIPCSRKILLDRWPWFHEQHTQLSSAEASKKYQKRTEMVITQTSLILSQSYPVTMALLQYFYSLALETALQRAPAVLSYLLLISTEFHIPDLRGLVTHAMHLALTQATAEGVYEIAASCGCRSLQIRAFRIHAESKDRKKRQAISGVPKTGRGRSNSEGTRPSTHKRSAGSQGISTVGFAPSAFTRPLHTNHAAASTKPAAAQEIPPVPSSVTRASDPTPRHTPRPEDSLPKQPQQELDAAMGKCKLSTDKTPQPSATAAIALSRKRSQSTSRLPRLASRPIELQPNVGAKASTTATRNSFKVPPVPNDTAISKGLRPLSRNRSTHNSDTPRSPIEGPRQQNRGRKMPTTVSAISKGVENMARKG